MQGASQVLTLYGVKAQTNAVEKKQLLESINIQIIKKTCFQPRNGTIEQKVY